MVRGVFHRLWPRLALASAALWLGACDSELITLGDLAGVDSGSSGGSPGASPTLRLRFGEPFRREELGAPDAKDDNPTLTADARTVFFTSTRSGSSNVYTATRPTLEDPFTEPVPVEEVNRNGASSSPAISLDGLSLWVGQVGDDDSGLDIWVTTRATRADAFGALENVSSLNSPADDIPRPPARNRVMPLGSRRAEPDADYRTYLAARSSELDAFGTPSAIPELESGKRVVDGFLTEDLLMLFFSSGIGEDAGDLYVAERASEDEAFGSPQLLDLSTGDDERDPWLSVDETRFFFSSNRSGDHEIFESVVSPH
jgi:hypothetical protein